MRTAVPGRDAGYYRLAELMMGARISRAIDIAARRGIADLLGDETLSAENLASRAGLPAGSLRRLMRSLSYAGVFQEHADGRFSNNEVSAHLRDDAALSLRPMTMVLNDDAVLCGWSELETVLETGQPAFQRVNGMSFFEHLAADPKRSENMARFMKSVYGPAGPQIAAGFDFGRFSRILDVGGGQGHILADILRTHPYVRGAVFDLPRTAEVARRFLAAQDVADRAEVVAGDFFEGVPVGYDAYFIKSTLHDWDDERSVAILRNIRAAMPDHGRVLIAEMVLAPGAPLIHPHRFIDLEMMVSFGGKERTPTQFAELLAAAGLKFEQVVAMEGGFFSVVEGSKG
jgi:SAM-dependent methyltransferase